MTTNLKQSRLKAWKNMYLKGFNTRQIAVIYDCSRQAVSTALNKMAQKTDRSPLTSTEIKRFYRQFNQGKNHLMISLLSKGRVTVKELRKILSALEKEEKAKKSTVPQNTNRRPEWLKLYKQGMSVVDIAKKSNVTAQAVYANLKKYGPKRLMKKANVVQRVTKRTKAPATTRKTATTSAVSSKTATTSAVNDWITRYLSGENVAQIAKRARTSTQKVSGYLRTHGVPARTYQFATDEILEFLRMYNQGNSVQDIARQSKKKVQPAFIRAILKKSGIGAVYESKDTIGQRAYQMRLEGKSWRHIANVMGKSKRTGKYRSEQVMLRLAKSYANTMELPWPPKKPVYKSPLLVTKPKKPVSANKPVPGNPLKFTKKHSNTKRTDIDVVLLCKRYKAGESITNIAKSYDTSRRSIYDRLRTAGILKMPKGLIDDQAIVKKVLEMHDKRVSIRTIAKHLKITRTAATRILKENKRDSARRPTENPTMVRQIVRDYDDGKSISSISRNLQIHLATVIKILTTHSKKYQKVVADRKKKK